MSQTLFVTPEWLAEHQHDPQVQVLDARMLPPGQEQTRNITQEYLAEHLPSAPFFDIEALSDHTSPYPHMMPRPEAFAVAMRELGICSDKHLVVCDEGSLFSAPEPGGCCVISAWQKSLSLRAGYRPGKPAATGLSRANRH